ncbi:hypothetical protein HK097_007795 [Rhizophlyctis rosea]|uniref:DUF4336 domain-containing protein n=1 Tax=Rhizophlyctis rosea TaxID=64517 RepID=A0AAD5SJP7_9FUNG|nr:hypothetical protein HK097_007795 [Rhizophlyctis rosea]
MSIRSLNPSLHIVSKPFHRPPVNIAIGIRMSVVRLQNGDVFVYGPTPLDNDTKALVDRLGPVRYIVCPNIVHHLYVKDYQDAYPAAKVFGVPGLREKRKDVNFTAILGQDDVNGKPVYGWENEIDYFVATGSKNKDVLFFHKPSSALFTADLLFNLPAHEQFSGDKKKTEGIVQSVFNRLANPDSAFHKYFLWYAMTTDRANMQAAARKVVNEWKPNVIVPAHGEVLETNALQKFRQAYEWFL